MIAAFLSSVPGARAAPGDLPGGMHSLDGLNNTVSTVLGGKTPAACRHDKSPAGASFDHGRGFYAESKCEVRCRGGGTAQTVTRDAPFNPSSLGLHEGDGALPYASLTSHLQNFASRSCLEAATIACGGIEKVDDAKFQGMKSGAWEMPPKLTCDASQPRILSPYDANFDGKGLRLTPVDPAQAGSGSPIPRMTSLGKFVPMSKRPDEKTQRFQRFSPPPTRAELERALLEKEDVDDILARADESHVAAGSCKTKVLSQTCYGNCICYTSGAAATANCPRNNSLALGSERENAYSEFTICADPLVDELRAKGLAGTSNAVLKHYCEDFAVRTITNPAYQVGVSEATGRSCAAYRGNFDCEGLIASLSSAPASP
jgi:hypothetical protein